ncbi:MAG: hypothetical protein R3E48_13365 [Burkholderiaceae bacterium]
MRPIATSSAPTTSGVLVTGAAASNTIRGATPSASGRWLDVLGNDNQGILVSSNASNTTIGGAVAGAANLISGNASAGVYVTTGAVGTIVQGNLIGLDASGTAARANGGSGIVQFGTAGAMTIGGAGAGNVISGNTLYGIQLSGAASTVQGNLVGTAVGAVALGNGGVGIRVESSGHTIGGNNTTLHQCDLGPTPCKASMPSAPARSSAGPPPPIAMSSPAT